MRKLKTTDIPAFCRCIKRIGVKEEIKKIAKSADKLKDAWSQGFELFWNIFDLATEKEGETHLYEFLAGPLEKTAEEVANMDLEDLFDSMEALAKENDLKRFFKFAAATMEKQN